MLGITGEELSDIRKGLPGLQFENFINPNDQHLQKVRELSHMYTVCHAVHGAYFVRLLNTIRRGCIGYLDDKRFSTRSEAGVLIQTPRIEELSIGIIGCGRIGRTLADVILFCAGLKPEQLLISTRRPELLDDLREKGVRCIYNNKQVASTCDVVFICVLSTQLQTVVDQIIPVLKERLKEQEVRNLIAAPPPDADPADAARSPKLYAYRSAPLVYSFVAGLSPRKLSQLLGLYPLALVARLAPSRSPLDARRASCADSEPASSYAASLPHEFTGTGSGGMFISEAMPIYEERPPQWNFTLAPRACLEQRELLEMSCPIFRSYVSPIRHEVPDLLERWTVALINYCSALGVEKTAALGILHVALYGQSRPSQPEKDTATTPGRVRPADVQTSKMSKKSTQAAAIEHTATINALPAPEVVEERFLTLEHFEYYLRNAQLTPPIDDQCLPLFALQKYQGNQTGGPIVIPVSRIPLPGIRRTPDAGTSQPAATRGRGGGRRMSEQPNDIPALYDVGPGRAAPRAQRDALYGRLLARLTSPAAAERFRVAYCDAILSGLKWLKFETAS